MSKRVGNPVRTIVDRLTGWLRRVPFVRPSSGLGFEGEKIAAAYLVARGYKRLGSNVRLAQGEIDLVFEAPDARTIVLVEVKARKRRDGENRPIAPEAAITARKRAKLLSLARSLRRHNGWEGRPTRIDVVGVEWPASGGEPLVRHHEAAVRA